MDVEGAHVGFKGRFERKVMAWGVVKFRGKGVRGRKYEQGEGWEEGEWEEEEEEEEEEEVRNKRETKRRAKAGAKDGAK